MLDPALGYRVGVNNYAAAHRVIPQDTSGVAGQLRGLLQEAVRPILAAVDFDRRKLLDPLLGGHHNDIRRRREPGQPETVGQLGENLLGRLSVTVQRHPRLKRDTRLPQRRGVDHPLHPRLLGAGVFGEEQQRLGESDRR